MGGSPFFARKKLTEIIGEGGVGKTATLVDLIAGVTRGRVFGTVDCEIGNVAILSAEDGAADTLVPRLMLANADLNRVRIFPKYVEADGKVEPLTFPEHLPLLENDLRRDRTSLLIIDPISAFVGGKTDTHNDSQARKFLAVIDCLAERTDCAIVYIRHVNKNSGESNAKNRGSGSAAFTNAPRLSYAIGFDPYDTEPEVLRKRIVAWVKGNICAPQPARAFRLRADENEIVHVEWLAETLTMTANDLFREPRRPRKAEALEEAIQFLHDELDEGPQFAKEIMEQAKARGISDATLKRARLKLGVRPSKSDLFGGPWKWSFSSSRSEL